MTLHVCVFVSVYLKVFIPYLAVRLFYFISAPITVVLLECHANVENT